MAIRFGNNSGGGNANGFIENQEAAPQNAAFWIDGNGHGEVFIADTAIQVSLNPVNNTQLFPQLLIMNGAGSDSLTMGPGHLEMDDNGTSFSIEVVTASTDIISDKPVVFANTNVQRDTAPTLPNDLVRLVDVTSSNGFIKNLDPATDPAQTANFFINGAGVAGAFAITTGGNFINTDTVLSGALSRSDLTFTDTGNPGLSQYRRNGFEVISDDGFTYDLFAVSPGRFRFSASIGAVFFFNSQVQSGVTPTQPNDLVRLTDLIATKIFTTGSIPFGIAGGGLGQDNANLFWDNTNKRLGIGTAAPKSKIDAATASLGVYAGVTAAPANSVIIGGNLGVNVTTGMYPFIVARTALVANSENIISQFADNATVTGSIIMVATTSVSNVVTGVGIRSTNSLPLNLGAGGFLSAIVIAVTGIVTIGRCQVTTTPTANADVIRLQDKPSGTFSQIGAATTVFTVTIGITMANTTYKIAGISPLNALSAALWYISAKTTTTFDVTYLAGLTGTVAFDWEISI